MDILLSSFLNPSGLSYVGQNYYRFFVKNEIRVIPMILGQPELAEFMDQELLNEMISASNRGIEDSPIQFHCGRADEIKLLKERDLTLGSIVLEGNRLIDSQIKVCNNLDAVLVPSNFCRNVCFSSGISKDKIFNFKSSAFCKSV